MIPLRSLLLPLLTALALSGCVLPNGTDNVGETSSAAPGEIEASALPDPGTADAAATTSDATKPKARPVSEPTAASVAGAGAKSGPPTQAATDAAVPKPAAAEELAPPEQAAPEVVKTPGQIACEKGGGRFVKAGQSASLTCVRPTRDGGKRCSKAGDCKGVCLARSGTCSPFTPVFGCQEILQEDGLRITECIE
jgi:hypothetical protein